MEKVTIYLHRYVYDGLRQFGTLDEVVNKILEAGESGLIDIYYRPQCPPPDIKASRYTITITNERYIRMRSSLGSNNSMISLRRILYWFIDNEIYIELGWSSIDYKTKEEIKAIKHLNKAKEEIETALTLLQDNWPYAKLVKGLFDKVEVVIDEIQ